MGIDTKIDTKTSEELLKHLYEDQPFPLYDTAKREEVLTEFRALRSSKNLLDQNEKQNPSQESLDFVFDLAQENRNEKSRLLSFARSKKFISLAASFLLIAVVGFWIQDQNAQQKAQEEAIANEEIRLLLEEANPWEDSVGDWNDHPAELDYLHLRTQEMQRVSDDASWDELRMDSRPNQGSIQQASSGN